MDDDLPLLFLSSENVEKAIRIWRISLLLALLLCHLLSSVLFKCLSKEQRAEKLNFCFSIALTYYNEYVKYDFSNGSQSHSNWVKECYAETLLIPFTFYSYVVDESPFHLMEELWQIYR
ncbi:hypothetical protein M9Y10_035901 [Tritrichomonas musculus]|uniref:Uncharacterized protein n=1 Tax=Tritrichomonas musculus TaxID=1915356 RepID=A0ABR2GWK2_9EUKA